MGHDCFGEPTCRMHWEPLRSDLIQRPTVAFDTLDHLSPFRTLLPWFLGHSSLSMLVQTLPPCYPFLRISFSIYSYLMVPSSHPFSSHLTCFARKSPFHSELHTDDFHISIRSPAPSPGLGTPILLPTRLLFFMSP